MRRTIAFLVRSRTGSFAAQVGKERNECGVDGLDVLSVMERVHPLLRFLYTPYLEMQFARILSHLQRQELLLDASGCGAIFALSLGC